MSSSTPNSSAVKFGVPDWVLWDSTSTFFNLKKKHLAASGLRCGVWDLRCILTVVQGLSPVEVQSAAAPRNVVSQFPDQRADPRPLKCTADPYH